MNRFIHLENLSVGINIPGATPIPILREITLSIQPGETLGLVGESGSGKSTVALAMMGYLGEGLSLLGGKAIFEDVSMFEVGREKLEDLRGGEICLVPQNAGQSLTPTMTIGQQIEEALMLHTELAAEQRKLESINLLKQVRLPTPEQIFDRHPHELSGGQQQRCAIAMALAGQPRALLLDEPTTGLDVTTQVHILELLKHLSKERGVAMIFVSHDLGAVARISDRIAVLYAGELMELGTSSEILTNPSHPYTRGLLASIPRVDGAQIPEALPGYPPKLSGVRNSCPFEPRCLFSEEICATTSAPLNVVENGRTVRCHFDTDELSEAQLSDEQNMEAQSVADEALLGVEDLAISYSRPGFLDKLFSKNNYSRVLTVSNINFQLNKGETIAVVGESGSGKSTILRGIAGLAPPCEGKVTLEETNELDSNTETRSLMCKKDIQMVFQNPDSSLNPRRTIAEIIAAPLELYFQLDKAQSREKVKELLESVRLTSDYMDRCPDQLSGGEKQRVGDCSRICGGAQAYAL